MTPTQTDAFLRRYHARLKEADDFVVAQLEARVNLPPNFRIWHLKILEVYNRRPDHATVASSQMSASHTERRVHYVLKAKLAEARGSGDWTEKYYFLTEMGKRIVEEGRKARGVVRRRALKLLDTEDGYGDAVAALAGVKMEARTRIDEILSEAMPKAAPPDTPRIRALLVRPVVASNRKGGRYTPDPKLPDSKKPHNPKWWDEE